MGVSFTGKGLDVDKKALRRGIGQEPPSGLSPIGNGWYATPDKPADPRDCERYPDSPWCGGQPFTRTPVGLEVEPTINECGVSLTINPVLGFTKLPPVSIAWIAPKCREEYEKPKHPPPEEVPPELEEPPIPLALPRDINDNAIVLIGITISGSSYLNWLHSTAPNNPYLSFSSATASGEVTYPGIYQVRDFNLPNALATSVAGMDVSVSGSSFDSTKGDTAPVKGSYTVGKLLRRDEPKVNNRDYVAIGIGEFASSTVGVLLYGKYGDIKKDWQGRRGYTTGFPPVVGQDGIINSDPKKAGYIYYTRVLKTVYQIAYLKILSGANPYAPPADDWKPKECCDMGCCTNGYQSQRKNDQDNAEILALLRRIDRKLGKFPVKVNLFDTDDSKRGAQSKVENIDSVSEGLQMGVHRTERNAKAIGIDELPIYVPSSIVEDESNGLLGDIGDIKNKVFKQRIDSVMEFNAWKAKNDYEIFGKWQEVIEIEDSDPTQKGYQPKRVVLPNMARTFREIVLLSSTQIKVLGMILDIQLKQYIDLANTKISAATCEAILKDVQDFLDYPTEEKVLSVPLGINVPADNDSPDDKEDINRFLQPSTAKTKFDDWTGEGSLNDALLQLLKAAQMIVAQYYNKV